MDDILFHLEEFLFFSKPSSKFEFCKKILLKIDIFDIDIKLQYAQYITIFNQKKITNQHSLILTFDN